MGQVSITADIWSDQNRRPFLAMTAHWIAKDEGSNALELKTALIAFHRIHGKHDGEMLAGAVLDLLDRARITTKVRLLHEAGIMMHVLMFLLKVGHFTLDNAANNGTMMKSLERMLRERDVAFDAADRKVMCFAHIINLCSGRVTRKAENRDDDDDDSDSSQSDDESVASSPIARARNVVRIIRASGTRRDDFMAKLDTGNSKGLFREDGVRITVPPKELLRDVRTRWDSVYLMLRRLREMSPVWLYFCRI